ncbi:dihydrolipoamide acyltransferase [Parasphingopyxis algicola]|uniref:biotin/lipoyl-containing protein n=1 Tax=Parasphingopyxis algicola TaxID=2026624 RepID=UPI0015A2D077|nr:biotin/lipoyl-containing protein [Parasphingopyxis algicola]QLC26448.1 dihydrolipoamide acyltransferase [Parasphingopyxis algicola]
MASMTLKMPKLAVSMQEGTLVEWLVGAGEAVSVGQAIYAVESEKTTFEVESPFGGTITPIAEVGETYPVGSSIAKIEV